MNVSAPDRAKDLSRSPSDRIVSPHAAGYALFETRAGSRMRSARDIARAASRTTCVDCAAKGLRDEHGAMR